MTEPAAGAAAPAPAPPPAPPGRGTFLLAAALLLYAFAFQAAWAVRDKSPVHDEPRYLGIGRHLLRTRAWDIDAALLHPPLSYYLNSLGLIGTEVDDRWLRHPDADRRGQILLDLLPGDAILHRARYPSVVLGLVLLVVVACWAGELYGRPAALLALALAAFEPNLLAHSALFTPDIALAATATLALYLGWRLGRRPTAGRVLAAGLALGLLLLAKYSALLLLPLVIVGQLAPRPAPAAAAGEPAAGSATTGLRRATAVVALGLATLWAGYLFRFGPPPQLLVEGRPHTPPWPAWLEVPAPAYLAGVEQQRLTGALWEANFINRRQVPEGVWYYFLEALGLKLPLPLLVLLAARAVAAAVAATAAAASAGRPRPPDGAALFLLLPAAALVAFFSLGRVQIGLRYVLPAIPLLVIWTAGLARGLGRSRALATAAVAALVLVQAASTVRAAPDFLAYFNPLAGGRDGGWRYLCDSNLDWGQDLPALRRWLDARGVDRIALAYLGPVSPARYGIRFDAIPGPLHQRQGAGRVLAGVPARGLVAVSATLLSAERERWEALAAREPVARVGGSIFVWELP